MPMIDWTASEAEEVRQLMLDRIDRLRERIQKAPAPETSARYISFISELRGILAKLEGAYAND